MSGLVWDQLVLTFWLLNTYFNEQQVLVWANEKALFSVFSKVLEIVRILLIEVKSYYSSFSLKA